MKIVIKIVLALSHIYMGTAAELIFEILLFLVFLVNTMKIFVTPTYCRLIDLTSKIIEWVSLGICFVQIFQSISGKEGVSNIYFALMIQLFIIPSMLVIEQYQRKKVLMKLANNQIKSSIEMEYALFLINELESGANNDCETNTP